MAETQEEKVFLLRGERESLNLYLVINVSHVRGGEDTGWWTERTDNFDDTNIGCPKKSCLLTIFSIIETT